MTDSSGTPEPAESPEVEEVRRLLADARHTEPMPDDVAARMDGVLADLRETPALAKQAVPAKADDGLVVSWAAQRRRRAAGMLVAAAAIVVGGVVVAQNLPQSTSSSASTAGSSAEDRFGSTGNAPRSPKPTDLSGQEARLGTAAPKAVFKDGRLVVRPQRFSADALAGQQLIRGNTRAADSLTSGTVSCIPGPTGKGEVLQATYQRAPAALVFRPASGGSQVVDLYVCGSHRPVRSTTLPAP